MKQRIPFPVFAFVVLSFALTSLAWAQQGDEPPKIFTRTFAAHFGGAGNAMEQGFGVAGVKVLDTMNDEVVKGAPFSGTLRTESTRTFADGNRIHQEGSSKMWRDKEGRVRTEAEIMLPPGLAQDAPTLISISDPVAKVRYVLEPERKIARKLPFAPEFKVRHTAGPVTAAGPGMMQIAVAPPPDAAGAPEHHRDVIFYSKGKRMDDEAKSENLGERDFDGVRATGTRLTTTIPAGEINNDRPIEIVSENWYAKSLKTTVMSKHSDPWAGDFTSRLTEINTNDPDPGLFAVPPGYSVVEDKFADEMLATPPGPK
jgi:hypothetical protein